MEEVTWTQMADGTREDYAMLGQLYTEHTQSEVVDNLVAMLKVMKGPKLGYQIDRYDHSLQSRTSFP